MGRMDGREIERKMVPWWLPGGHAQTVFPSLFRRVARVTGERERLELADGDFLDLEWGGREGRRLAVVTHGLEGSAGAAYVQGMARALVRRGWDVLAWNLRGCGGEPNRLPRFYHSGATEDLGAVVDRALAVHGAERVALVGFSLGGNLTLKFLGEQGSGLDGRIVRAVAFSVPCDLACSAAALERRGNRIYMARFMRTLREKIREKHGRFPEAMSLDGLDGMRTFREFDDRYTAPLHGFRDAADYWARSSCRGFLPEIGIPTLLVNARNDPFLGPRCFPEGETGDRVKLVTPTIGGHVGFSGVSREGEYASERMAGEFLEG
jgi:predicted alpha/beta-fold hydrolase